MDNEIKLPSSCGWKDVLKRVSAASALFAVVIAMIFIFVIGFAINNPAVSTLADSLGDFNLNKGLWIYDYFGSIYKQIDEATKDITSDIIVDMYSFVAPSMYIPAVIGTLISAGTLVTVITLGAISISKLARKLSGKEVIGAEKYAFATALTYILGCVALKVFQHVSVKMYTVSMSSISSGSVAWAELTVDFTFNTATIVGIVLCAVALGASLACNVASRGAELKNRPAIYNLVFTVISVALAGVIAHFAACATYTSTNSDSGMMLNISMPTSTILQLYAQKLGLTEEPFDAGFVMFLIVMIIQLAVVAVAFTSIITQINSILCRKEEDSLVVSIPLTVVCFVYLIVALIAISEKIQGEGNAMQGTFTPCIVALLISVLGLCCAIVRAAIRNATTRNNPTIAANDVEIDATEADA